MTSKRATAKSTERRRDKEPPRVVRIWTELDGDDLEKLARHAAAEQPSMRILF
ncbi:hypothetical protein ACFWUU_02105 [Kribbella sp. NPDC058693]|uniref:hypothetical protein n=1 Tax=Kribbella sp. NPDC058693 TaxID=3346602 RepID=UPI0036664681